VPALNGHLNAKDLLVAAARSWLVVIDNVSRLDASRSDMLCVLATGTQTRQRALYTDADAFTLQVKRPVVVTSIGHVAGRPDLVDRSIPISLPRIPDDLRQCEAELDTKFQAARPQLFGVVVEALVAALRDVPHTTMPRAPRMADVALLITAAERGLGLKEGAFYKTLVTAQGHALDDAVEANPFIAKVIELIIARDAP